MGTQHRGVSSLPPTVCSLSLVSYNPLLPQTPGEDPYLTGEYAEWYTKGMQQAPEDPYLFQRIFLLTADPFINGFLYCLDANQGCLFRSRYHIQASACCKHYVANSMDGTTEKDGEHHDRNHVDSIVPMQDLIDSYMLPFQSCVEKGQVTSLMCSYNAVNGVPSCANDWLLNQVAREEWGFDGYSLHSTLVFVLLVRLCVRAIQSVDALVWSEQVRDVRLRC